MTVMVKICGLTDVAAVTAAVDAGADAIGFVFAESVRRISPAQARSIAADVPGNILRIAVMLHPTTDEWLEVQQEFRPDVLQTDAADFEYLNVADDVRRWPVVREGQHQDDVPEEFVYEGLSSGQGQTVDWGRAAAVGSRGRMILAGGLSAANVAEAIAAVAPWGVDVSSGVEDAPGHKDPARIYEFVSVAKAADLSLQKCP